MELLPIKEHIWENTAFIDNPACHESLYITIGFYKKVGFVNPWIGYYASDNNEVIGAGGFKGPPVNGAVEIAYGTFELHRNKGVGSAICKQLVDVCLKTDPLIRITARTLPEPGFSTKILEKNNFKCLGIVVDPNDGEVWEWEYRLQ